MSIDYKDGCTICLNGNKNTLIFNLFIDKYNSKS